MIKEEDGKAVVQVHMLGPPSILEGKCLSPCERVMSEFASSLKQRLWDHPLEHADQSRDLVRRLALEHRWTLKKARATVEEYRRFCFLACIADHPVTPSEEVDAVWHLHLLHTRDYWDVFCPHVLQRPLHHGPTLGGKQEEARFYEQYAKTLSVYQHHFGAPNPEFWPSASERFQASSNWCWVYLPQAWVISKPRWWKHLQRRYRTFIHSFQQPKGE